MPRARSALRPGVAAVPAYVAYYRVSTDKQGRSGLGLDAQREAVSRYISGVAGELVAQYEEVESGKRADRPQLLAAIGACRLRRATLVIAKLDRLTRNLAFLANLMESKVEFVCCDNPHATRFTIHILAAVAEHEREMISVRTKDAMAAAKVRGVRMGNPHLRAGTPGAMRGARAERTRLATQHTADVLPYVESATKAGATSLRQIAEALTARGIQPPSGGDRWYASQVRRIVGAAHTHSPQLVDTPK